MMVAWLVWVAMVESFFLMLFGTAAFCVWLALRPPWPIRLWCDHCGQWHEFDPEDVNWVEPDA